MMESIAGSVAGSVVGGLFGNSGGESTASRSPWGPAIPYLTGGEGITGVLPESARLYDQSQWSPEMQQAYLQQLARLQNSTGDSFYNDIVGGAKAIMQGQYDPDYQRVANINGARQINPGSVTPQSVDMNQIYAGMGSLNPSSSIESLLSGTVSNPYLSNQADSIVNQLTRNTLENVMPAIRSGAVANGYGSSRQGIAEGLAASRLNQDVSRALSNLYGNAYEQAQNRMLNTSQGMSNLGLNNAQNNANRDLTAQQYNIGLDYQGQVQNAQNDLNTQQFNANLGLSNNSQAFQNAGVEMANRQSGMNMLGQGWNMYNGQYNNLMNTLAYPNNYAWGNLNNYANIANSIAGQGGVTTSDQNGSTLGNMIGGASLGNSIFNQWGNRAGGDGFGLNMIGASPYTGNISGIWS